MRAPDFMVDPVLTHFMRRAERRAGLCGGMEGIFITSRAALTDATQLIEQFGDEAALAASMRANESRNAENVLGFCHWRQIERVVLALASDEVQGTVH